MTRKNLLKSSSERHAALASALADDNRTNLFSVLHTYFYDGDADVKIIRGKACVDCDYSAEGLWVDNENCAESVTLSHDLCVALKNWNNWLDYIVDVFWLKDEYRVNIENIKKDKELFRQVQKRLAMELKKEAAILRIFYRHGTWLGYEDDDFYEIRIDVSGNMQEFHVGSKIFSKYKAYISY